MKRAFGVLAAILTLTGVPKASSQPSLAGAAKIQLALDGLTVKASALMIAAHPDDENTALLAWLARGRKVRTGYLSLTRGDGGQNLIGSEQGALLGVIREQELLAARRVDGAEQYFTSATDFGYSKTAEETLAKWGREKILGDVVRVIRTFRPDVIILRFSGTPRDGHGHHQASAMLGKESFDAAADPKRFPEQLTTLKPWRAKRVVWNAFSFSREQEAQDAKIPGRIEVDLGEYDPLLGYSYSEIAGISRSQHQSQGMGSPERRGSQKNFLVHVAGEAAKADVFDGVDVRTGIPELEQAARTFDPRNPEKTIPLLLAGRARHHNPSLVDEAIALCAGLFLDAGADRPLAASGSAVKVSIQAVNRSRADVHFDSVEIGQAIAVGQPLDYNKPVTRTASLTATTRDVTAVFKLRVGGQPVELRRPVWHRYVDKVRGELTRPFEVVPPVSVKIAEPVLLFPDSTTKKLTVQVRSFGAQRSGTVRLDLPAGWRSAPAGQPFSLALDGQETTVSFTVTPPAGASTAEVRAIADVAGTETAKQVLVIDYPHIPQQTVFLPATAKLVRTPVVVKAKRVGYVMGAGDEVAALLPQIGVDVTLLSDADLARGDLSGFDAIVTGVRAYNTRADLRANQHRLLDYVRAGGNVVVQYNVVEGGPFGGDPTLLDRIGPYPLKVGRDRVSVEEAPIETLKAGHPLLTSPNAITAADWDGWIQERGLYFASEWDPQYEAVISTHDPGEPARPGGMLYTRYGKGTYVFTGYSWFRQLPAGVPGAWRIFANLLGNGRGQ